MIEMTNYFNIFEKDTDYEAFKGGEKYVTPNICIVENENAISYKHHIPYLTFEAIEDTTFKLTQNACQYSLNNGGVWVDLPANTETPTVSAGNKIMFKCTNPSISSTYGIGTFSSTGKFNVRGNIMSLLYGDNFIEQTDLTGKNYAFYNLFSGCTNVVATHNLILPATTLSDSCYYYMFRGCTSLVTAPELPATTLAYGCYQYMFRDCTSLVNAPALPTTTLARYCYYYMFNGCTSLVTAPELPATTLASDCYANMFYGCTSLENAPELPATTLANSCYSSMFRGCTSLVTAPELPATTLASYCYAYMFQDCTSLVTAPELPATTLADGCYQYMFEGCSKLNNITMLATDINARYCLKNWVDGVALSGTFMKHIDTPALPTGINGIPSGWTVQDYVA